ncbi:hypothetical protein FG147_10705 [Thauera sp. UPWRP]|nr:hypothetical protein FG147_10705 [Thauera sp. UPWRP]
MIHPASLNDRERLALQAAVGQVSTSYVPNSTIEPFELNLAETTLLVDLGLTPDEALRVRATRPHYQLDTVAVQAQLSEAGARVLQQFFVVSPLRYVDPTTHTWRTLHADPSEWVIDRPPSTAEDIEGVPPVEATADASVLRAESNAPARSRKLRPKARCVRRTGLARSLDAEAEEGRAFPAFLDEQKRRRYLHPEFVQVQARGDVTNPAVVKLLQTLDLRIHHIYTHPGLFVARVGDGRHGLAAQSVALMALNAAPCVELAEPAWLSFDDIDLDAEDASGAAIAPPEDTPPPADALPWNLALLRAQALPTNNPDSAEVHLACIDSGVELDHPCLVALNHCAQRMALDFTGEGLEDRLGHGTSVASILVGNGQGGVWGLAPNSSLAALKVELQASPLSYASRRAALMSLVPQVQAGQRWVVNLSWRTAGDVALIRTAIDALSTAGALVVCSSGNEGREDDAPHYPSDYPSTLSVGAVDADGQRAPYSNVSPEVDLMGPGGTVSCPLVCGVPGGGTAPRIGTSFAAPHVAAVAALVWALRPDASAAQVRSWVENSARKIAGQRIPDLRALSRLVGRAVLDTGHTPVPSDRMFPLSGAELLVRCAACGIRPITARILLQRPALGSWTELAAILGMDESTLDRIWTKLHAGV